MTPLVFSQLNRFGAAGFGAAFVLFSAWTALTWAAGPPTVPVAVWAAHQSGLIAWADEALMFAAFALVPGWVALGLRAWTDRPRLTLAGLATGLMGVVVLVVADLALGRVVYPVFGLVPTEAEVAASVGAYFGALHAFDLMTSASVVVWAFALRRPKGVGALVGAAAVFSGELLSAFPWLFSPPVVAALRLPWLVWLAGAAYFLVKTSPSAPLSTTTVSSSE